MPGTSGQSDDEFLNNLGDTPDVGTTSAEDKSTTVDTTVARTDTETTKVDETPVVDDATASNANAPVAEKNDGTAVDDSKKASDNATPDSSVGSTTEGDSAKPTDTDKGQAEGAEPATEVAVNYEGFYKEIMTPFKANGKMIQLKDPKEAIQLMQMGANYTRKLQELQPHRKMMLMLQNNGLMDEEKLSFLIDLDKRNPEAIKKLVKEAGIDPLDIDTSKEPTYQAGNHKVTDAEANFRQVLEEVGTTPEGKSTLQLINDGWDQASKEVLWKQPELMTTMHNQREAGVYQIVVDEIQRQRTLGTLSANTTFLDAYRIVGDKLLETTAFDHLPAIKQLKPVKEAAATVVTTRTAVARPAVKNGDKASAASPSRSTPRTATTVNPLSMSDDDFLKQMEHRL
jgi:hypothetical protein